MMSERPPPKLPVLVLTGFLGSGKTTLLNRLIEHWPRSAVLINEFGATPVDQRLLGRSDIALNVLAGGCLCCQVQGALAPTLKNLWMAWNRQKSFERLIIEASGVASPEPVLDVLLRERWLAPRLFMQGVATTLAAPSALEQLARFPEAMAQAVWADALVLTQTDLADAQTLSRLEAKLQASLPATPRMLARRGELDPEALLEAAGRRLRRVPTGAEPPGHSFHSVSLRLEQPLAWPRLDAVLGGLLKRPKVLRAKGVVYLAGEPVAVQGAHGHLHPPLPLPPRDADDGIGRLVLITDGEIDGLAEEIAAALREA